MDVCADVTWPLDAGQAEKWRAWPQEERSVFEERLGALTVADVRHLLVEEPTVVRPDESVESLLAKMIEDPRTRHVYVVDEEGVLLGSVRMNTVVEYLFPLTAIIQHSSELSLGTYVSFSSKTIRDLMNDNPRFVQESTLLSEVARILIEEKINELPVVDQRRRVIGQINVYEIISAYLKGLDEQKRRQ